MRRHKAPRTIVFLLLLLAAGSLFILSVASGQQQAETLADGPGADLVRQKCSLCHELGHIMRIRQTREEWEDTVQTMIKRGAPVTPADVAGIVDYLTKHYGK